MPKLKRKRTRLDANRLRMIGIISVLLVKGASEQSIKRVMKMKYRLRYAVTIALVKEIFNKWNEDGEQEMKLKRRRAIEARKAILIKAWERDNLDLVLRVEDSLSKIEGTEFSSEAAADTSINFDITLHTSNAEEKQIEEYADDLENPGAFEKRVDRQTKQFGEKLGLKQKS